MVSATQTCISSATYKSRSEKYIELIVPDLPMLKNQVKGSTRNVHSAADALPPSKWPLIEETSIPGCMCSRVDWYPALYLNGRRKDIFIPTTPHRMLRHFFLVDVSSPNHLREEAGFCDDIHRCRTLVGIINGCLATIFASTWVSVHPNIPPPNLGQLALTRRRFCLMLVAVIAPELMVGLAVRQFLDARWFSKGK